MIHQWEVWKTRPPGFATDHWFVILSGQERLDSHRHTVNGLACFTLRGVPPFVFVYFVCFVVAFSEILWPMRDGRAALLRGQAAQQRRPTEQTLGYSFISKCSSGQSSGPVVLWSCSLVVHGPLSCSPVVS